MILKELIKNHFISLIFVFLIFLLDRISKIYIIYLDKINNTSKLFLSKFLNIELIWNEGIAFGLFQFEKNHLYNVLTFFILIVIVLIFFVANKSEGLKKYSLLMIFGGALGNVFDRIFYKSVPDFIDFHFENFHWFIFNVADIFITMGVIFMILLEITDIKKEKKL